jgi:Baseplate J-like protein
MNGHAEDSLDLRGLNDCGCCEGVTARTPYPVDNLSGLGTINYRVGSYPEFKQSLIAALSTSARPALRNLNTRDTDDFAIALCDAWATVADVLTFYQERIANELFLRTATERLSVLQLARLIGYELRPGVAAGTYLAFTLEDAPGAPRTTTIDVGAKVQSTPGPGEKPQTFETVEAIDARPEWNAMKPQMSQPQSIIKGMTELYLKGVVTQLQPGDGLLIVGAEQLQYLIGERWDFRIVQTVRADAKKNHTHVTWSEPVGHNKPFVLPAEEGVSVYAFRQRAALFGHNAPDWTIMPEEVKAAVSGESDPTKFPSDWPSFALPQGVIDLDAVYPKVTSDGWVVLAKPNYVELYRIKNVTSVSRAQYALSAKVTRVIPDIAEHLQTFGLRQTTVYVQNEELLLAETPIAASVSGDSIALDRAVDGLSKGRQLIFSGKEHGTDQPVAELAAVKFAPVGDFKTITLETPLKHAYQRESLIVYANVARATHGETARDVLGGGDPTRPVQRFTLRQPPLTYVSAPTAAGSRSTLEVRVNDVLWHEVPTVYGHGPGERVYVTRREDDGKTTVQFGPGTARLPSGTDNVRATYRKGIGREGNVEAGQLNLLLTRPLGVKEVINPLPATGGDDPEALADARTNATLTIRALDRIVSLRDYQDFARAFPGVAKALATWTWNGRNRGVFVTVAGPDGDPILADSPLFANLLDAMRKASQPFVPLQVESYAKAMFKVAGRIEVHPDYSRDLVLSAVQQALSAAFSFEARTFGQPVMLSEVIAVVHSVAGVELVDVDLLHRNDAAPGLSERLLAEMPHGETPSAAELLTIDPASLEDVRATP